MRSVGLILTLTVLWLIFCLVFTASGDFNQDLGRHIKLGEIIVDSFKIPGSNLFSYTHPGFPFSNHHWLSEMIYYFITSWMPKTALLYLKVILILASAFMILKTAERRSGSTILSIIGLLLVSPLLLERSDIRPEMFGYIFFAVLLNLLFGFPNNKKYLYVTIPVMIVWVNIHITFIFGVFLLGLFLMKLVMPQYLRSKTKPDKKTVLILIIAIGSTIINPNGIFGVTYPFNISANYGYTIVENQSLFFLNGLMYNHMIRWFALISPVMIISALILLWKRKIIEFIILAAFFTATIYQIRHMPFFIWASVIPFSVAFAAIIPKKIKMAQNRLLGGIFLTCLMLTLSIFLVTNSYARTFDKAAVFGGIMNEDGKKAADFMLENNLDGNIFNNFDIGGYAIYRLYPKYKVFVDNRPEAYPADFFTEVYIPMQYDPQLRKKIFDEYNINTIFFSHTDQTPRANEFLRSIASDTDWKLIYLDNSIMIMSRNSELADIRNNDKYLKNKIMESDYYLDQLKIYRILSIFGKNELAKMAYEQAVKDNPGSCAINRSNYERYKNSPRANEAVSIKNNYWYCF